MVLAPFVGAFADRLPKGQVMFIANTIKIVGCVMMLFGAHPLLAYAIVGLGAAAYSPAKYGILTEYLPHRKLVIANGWIEGLTVASIILGMVLGGVLIHVRVSGVLLALRHAVHRHGDRHAGRSGDRGDRRGLRHRRAVQPASAAHRRAAEAAAARIRCDTRARFRALRRAPVEDRLGQISLAVTTLFWGAGATLQFIVIEWARAALGFDLSKAAILQGVTAVGIALGAVLASAVGRRSTARCA